ncbi:MAG TPA: hypothetical protein VEG32_00710 [Clostridia bacterium]|nr:hypothetical protein [Clostridia bacterium]
MSVTQTDTMAAALEALGRQLEEMRREMTERIANLEARLSTAPAPASPLPKPQEKEEVSAETIALIAASVTAYLGKKVRVRSARRVFPAGTNSWAQQGRVFVQASHNLSR